MNPNEFFAHRGWSVESEPDAEGVWWATLVSVENPTFRVERYGRGEDAASAAERAMRRWQVGQEND